MSDDKIKYLFIALRPKQWIKNFIIFLPLVFGQRLFIFPVLLKTILSFIIFSIASSAAYLINDIIDFEKDRIHPLKRLRPLARGKITVFEAASAAVILSILSIVFSFAISFHFGLIILIYIFFNLLYTKILKSIVIIDVLCIGFFFLLRILIGCVIAEVALSHWIIFCTVLLALFIGFNKRRCELKLLEKKAISHRAVLARYDPYFIDQMISIISSTALIMYMLYTVDDKTIHSFGNNHLLYTIPFVFYGLFRYLYNVHRLNRGDDPVRIFVSDKKLQLNLVLWLIVCIIVIYFKV